MALGLRIAVLSAMASAALIVSGCVSTDPSERPSLASETQPYDQLIALLTNLNVDDRQAVSEQLAVALTLGSQSESHDYWVAEVPDHPLGVGRLNVDYRERTVEPERGDLLVLTLPQSRYTYADAERLHPNLPVMSVPNHSRRQHWVFVFPGGRNEVRLGFSNSRPMYLRVISARRRGSS